MPTPDLSPKSSKSVANPAELASQADGLPRFFEQYLLLKRIAKGGMGEVFLATSSGAIDGAERPCVVKVIREEHAEDSSFLARFLDEARIQSQLEHPGVVRVVNATHDEQGKPYVVLEHVEGRNLSEVRLRVQQLGVKMSWPDAVAVALGLCEALAHIHERTDALGRPLHIVHRDSSPQNVMVAYGGDVKLIDFGTARGQNRKCHTVSGIVFAKPGYVAPEVANNQPGGIPADLYAVGIMFWEMLAGRRFIVGDAAEHLAQVAAGTKTVSNIAELVDAPPELDLICQRLTATNIADRYESARECASDLAQLLKRAPSTTDGQRSVRVRIAQLMQRLYPAEPTRTRAEFQRLLAAARNVAPPASALVPPPSPPPPPAENAVPLLPGTRYELAEPLGEGASGVVYAATHVDLARPLAIKLFNVEGKVSDAAFERFRSEARVAAQLTHENVVSVHDFGSTSDGRVYLAMERLEGQSLDKHLCQTGALEYRSALLLALQMCRALEAAHALGIVHGDLKPQNLFLTRKGTMKLLDFGVSALYRAEGGAESSNSTAHAESASRAEEHNTDALALTGTLEYLAPEQLRGDAATPSSDQYALGVVLYEMITASRPHDAESLGALFGAKLAGVVQAPSLRAPAIALPKSVDRLCLRLLAANPADRYIDVTEAREAMEAILSSASLGHKRPARPMRVAAVSAMLVFCALASASASAKARGEIVGFGARAESWARGRLADVPMPKLASFGAGLGSSMSRAVASLTQSTGATKLARSSSPLTAAPQSNPPLVAQGEDVAVAEDVNRHEPAAAHEVTKAQDDRLSNVREALASDKPVKALELARTLGSEGVRSPELYRLWIDAATRTRAWGEAHRTAKRLSEVEPTAENTLRLAQLERRLGKSEAARRTLLRLLSKSPNHAEALALLGRIEGNTKVASR
ncbi:MAG: protein kinase [Polyangiaceae bacterium]